MGSCKNIEKMNLFDYDAMVAQVAEWQTRRTQNPLTVRSCGFDSHPGHIRSPLVKSRSRNAILRYGFLRLAGALAKAGHFALETKVIERGGKGKKNVISIKYFS